ncbi:hypothetical protein AOLI_G00167820 [Acnodon oligacanthus]
MRLGKPWNQKSEKIKYCRSLHVDNPPCIPSLTTSYVHGTSTVSLLPLTVNETLQKTAAQWPDREAVVFHQDNIRKTFSQLLQDADQLAAGLIALGLKKGDRLGLWLPDLRMVIVTDSRQPGMLHVDDVMQAAESQHYQQLDRLQRMLSFDDPINIQFTSGTTGIPKGVTLSHHNIVNNAYFVGLRMGYSSRPNMRVCVPVPMYHCFGSVLGGVCKAVHGITLVFPSAMYNGRANLEAIQKERCTVIYGTPTMYIDLLSQPNFEEYDLSSVETGIVGGSSCPSELMKRVRSVMNVKGMTVAYGTTENSPITFLRFPLDGQELRTETVGCIMNHTEAKVVEPSSGKLLPLGQTGELLIRGYCVMRGYWNEPDKTRKSISDDGWYKTGDIASLDGFGYCRIEGRMKDMIIRGGENIYPAEIEQLLYTHPKVKEVQVIGVKDERLGEQVCACIKLAEGDHCTEEEIREYCKGQISHFKIPYFVLFVDSYPLTASGKIQKNELRAEMEQKLGLCL